MAHNTQHQPDSHPTQEPNPLQDTYKSGTAPRNTPGPEEPSFPPTQNLPTFPYTPGQETPPPSSQEAASISQTANQPPSALPPPEKKQEVRDPSAPTDPMESAPTPDTPSATWPMLDDYEIIEEIARGGMGVVYKARQRSLNRLVALKMILPGAMPNEVTIQRFREEALAAAGLDHPNIVPVYDFGERMGQHYFTMAFIEGTSLKSLVGIDQLPPIQQVSQIGQAIAEAVDYAHQRGIIHRDLKPANVLIDQNGRPRVTDFGLAKRVEENAGLTMSGQVFGTPPFMPPEQAMGNTQAIGPAADIYSLGAVLYFLLTGQAPFSGNVTEVLLHVINTTPVSPGSLNPAVPAELEAICMTCLEKDIEDRYPSAGALAAALREFNAQFSHSGMPFSGSPLPQGITSTSPPSQLAGSSGRQSQRAGTASQGSSRRWLMVGGLLVLVLLAVGSYLGFQAWKSNQEGPAESGTFDTFLQRKGSLRQDFNLKVKVLGGQPDDKGVIHYREGQKMKLEIESDRDAYMTILSIAPDQTVTELLPNKYEPDNFFKAGQPRKVPGEMATTKYDLEATPNTKPEHIWVIASSDPLPLPPGQPANQFTLYQTITERKALVRKLRGIKIVPRPESAGSKPEPNQLQLAEHLFRYRVAAR